MDQSLGRGGWLLVGLIILISAVILALAGITFFLTEHLRSTSLRQNHTKAIYLAQAGVMRELYDFRSGNDISLSEVSVTAGPAAGTGDDDVYDVAGPQADFLLVSLRGSVLFSTPFLCPSSGAGRVARHQLNGWVIRNVLGSGQGSLRIDAMQVNWPSVAGEGVLRIDLNGNTVWTAPGCAPVASGAPINISSQTITAGTRWRTNRIWFATTNMNTKAWIDVAFTMQDGSQRVARYATDVTQRSADFTLRAQGIVRLGAFPFSVWRRLQAEYRICQSVSGAQCDTNTEERNQPGAIISQKELVTLTP